MSKEHTVFYDNDQPDERDKFRQQERIEFLLIDVLSELRELNKEVSNLQIQRRNYPE